MIILNSFTISLISDEKEAYVESSSDSLSSLGTQQCFFKKKGQVPFVGCSACVLLEKYNGFEEILF